MEPGAALSQQEFDTRTAPLRAELVAHCYRMFGSYPDAEDAVQETLLRAWRAVDQLRDGDALRPWLYRVATRVCLDALRRARRRRFPPLDGPAARALPSGGPLSEVPWLTPCPELAVTDQPEARYALAESLRLAFVALLQQLPARQRAVLLLADVLGWSPTEVAETLATTVTAVRSALARARLRVGPPRRRATTDEEQLARAYVEAWEAQDLQRLGALLQRDVILAMPPWGEWYAGRPAVLDVFAARWPVFQPDRFALVPVRCAGGLGFAHYLGRPGSWRAHSLHVVEADGGQIASLVAFLGTAPFRMLGLPEVSRQQHPSASEAGD